MAQKLLPGSAPGGAIVKAQTSKISASTLTPNRDKFYVLKVKVIEVDKILKNSFVTKKKEEQQKVRIQERESRKKGEEKLEKPKTKEEKETSKLKLPGLSFLDRIKKFIFDTLAGFVLVRLVEHADKILPVVPLIGKTLDTIVDLTIGFVDGLGSFVKAGYDLYDSTRGWIKDREGEDALRKFDAFGEGLKNLINAALIVAMAQQAFKPDKPGRGGPGRGGPGGGISKPSAAERVRNARIRNIQTRYGPGARKIYENALNNGKSPAQAEAAVKRGFKKGVAFRPGADSLAARTAPKGSIFKGFGQQGLKKGIDKATQRFFLKIVGMGGVKVLKGILNKIPVIGPLITFALNWASGESIARSGAMAVGSGLGQMLGTWAGGALGALGGPLAHITVPLGGFLGNVLGSMGGELLGGFLFDLVTGKKGKPGEVFSSAIAIIRKFFEKDFQNVVKGFLSWIGNTLVSGAKGLWNALTAMAKFIGGLDFFKALGKATNNIRYSLKQLWEKKGDIFNPLKIVGYIGTIRSVLGELFKIMVFPGLGKFLLDNAVVPFFNSIGNLWKNKDKFFNFLMNSAQNVGAFVMKEGTFQDITGGPDLSLSEGIEGLNTGGRVEKDTKRTAPTSGSTKPAESPLSGSNAVITAAKRAVSSGKRGPATPPCASWVRMVLGMAGHPAARKTTKVGDLDPEKQQWGPNMAASFAGSDMGTVIRSQGSLMPGDVVLHKNTFGNYPPGAITHVSIASDTKGKVLHQPTSGGPPKEGGIFKFAAGIRLGGTGSIGFSDQDGSGSSGGSGGDTGSGGGFTSPIMALANLLEEIQKTSGSSTSTSGESGVKNLVKTLDPERSTSSSFSGVPSKSTSGLSELAQMLSYNEPEPNTQLIFVTKETYIK